MAENLGTAVLRLEVDDTALREGLAQARRLIEGTSVELGRQTRNAGRAQRASAAGSRQGGARESTRALEIAQEKRFRLSQRINALEERGANVARLRSRLGQLTEAQSQRQFGTFRLVSRELARQVTLTETRQQRTERAARAERQLAGLGARQGGARESITARFDAQKRRYSLDQQIRSLEAAGVNTDRLRVQLGAVTEAQAARRFGSAKQLGAQLGFQLQKERDLLSTRRQQERVATRLARQGGGRSPIGGAVDIPGSPAFLAAQRRFNAQDLSRAAAIGGPRSPIGGALNLPGSPAALRAEQRLAEARAKAAKAANDAAVAEGRRIGKLNASPIRGGAAFPGSPAFLEREQARAIELERRLARERLRTADATLKALADERKAGQQRRSRLGNRVGGAVSSGLIGGGFPLLFGQGPGASLGGAFGGVAGGALGGGFGFALSIVGTAVGQAFDEALNKGKTLAAGLDDPIGKFEELRQAGLISSKAVEKSVASLIAQGREAEAAAKIQLDLSNAYGDTSGLDDLNNAYDELGRSFSQLSVITAKFVAGPLSDFLNKLSGAFSAQSTQALLKERLAGAPQAVRDEALAARRAAFKEASQGGAPGGAAIAAGNLAALRVADERLGKTKQVQQAEAAIALATARQNDLRSLSFRQIDAQVQGYERLGLELEKQRIEQQRLQDLSVPKADADAINRKAAQDTYTVQQQLNQLTQDRIATQSLEVTQNRLALAAVQERISAARQLGSLEEGVARSTLETALNIKASIAEAKRREQEIGAQIDAARIRGGDAGEAEASRLVDAQRVAAEETKLRIIEGANTLRQTGQSLKQAIIDGANRYRGVLEGSFNLLRSGVQQRLVAEARGRIDYSLFDERKLRSPQDLFSAASASEQLRDIDKQIADSSKALASVNTELVSTNKQLTEAVAALVQKDWSVNAYVSASTDSVTQSELLRAASLP